MKTIGYVVVGMALLIGQSVASPIYKWTDSQGNVHFTDQPHPGAEEVHLPPVQIISSPKEIQQDTPPKEPVIALHRYDKVSIEQPEDQTTIRNTEGFVPVLVQLTPALQKGDKVQIFLDADPLGEPEETTSFDIKDIQRGSHTLKAKVFDSTGKVLKSSEPITIYMMPPRVGMVHHNTP